MVNIQCSVLTSNNDLGVHDNIEGLEAEVLRDVVQRLSQQHRSSVKRVLDRLQQPISRYLSQVRIPHISDVTRSYHSSTADLEKLGEAAQREHRRLRHRLGESYVHVHGHLHLVADVVRQQQPLPQTQYLDNIRHRNQPTISCCLSKVKKSIEA